MSCAGEMTDDIQAAAVTDADPPGEVLIRGQVGREALASPAAAQRVGELSLRLLQAIVDFKDAHHEQQRPLLLAALSLFAPQDAAAPDAISAESDGVCILCKLLHNVQQGKAGQCHEWV